jgi:hypothetical protein
VPFKLRPLRNARGNLAEFAPALCLYFAILLIPIFGLLRLGLTIATVHFIEDCAADAAARESSYNLAENRADAVLRHLVDSPIGCLAGLKTQGFKKISLYVDERLMATGQTNVYSPTQRMSKPISIGDNIYEYDLRTAYLIDPLVPGSVPLLGKIPMLNEPVILYSHNVRPVEYPEGLNVKVFDPLKAGSKKEIELQVRNYPSDFAR